VRQVPKKDKSSDLSAWNIQLFQGPSENLLDERAEEETTDKVIYGIEGTLTHPNVRMVQEIRLRNMFTFM
jgi:predicted TIM-barrel fold metal-dependent hydrolase